MVEQLFISQVSLEVLLYKRLYKALTLFSYAYFVIITAIMDHADCARILVRHLRKSDYYNEFVISASLHNIFS